MNKSIMIVLALSVFALGIAGCSSSAASPPDEACSCDDGKAGEMTWCAECSQGFVKGEKVSCKGCYTEKTGGPACPSCSSN